MLAIGKKLQEEASRTQASPESASSSHDSRGPGVTYTLPTIEAVLVPQALSEREMIAGELAAGTLSGFVGGDMFVSGDATFTAMLRIDGRFSGRITSGNGTLIVDSGGWVDANTEVSVLTVHGIVHGEIIASQRVELGRAAKLLGNIQTPVLVIEPGAIFEGKCKMMEQPAAIDKPNEDERKNVVAELVETSDQKTGNKSNDAREVTALAAAN